MKGETKKGGLQLHLQLLYELISPLPAGQYISVPGRFMFALGEML